MDKETREKFENIMRSGTLTPEQLVKLKRGIEKGATGYKVDEVKSMKHLSTIRLVDALQDAVCSSTGDEVFKYDFVNESFDEPDATIDMIFASGITFDKKESKMFASAINAADVVNVHSYGMMDGNEWLAVSLLFKDVMYTEK